MNREQIIKALELCISSRLRCKECPYFIGDGDFKCQRVKFLKDIRSLIRELIEENERLRASSVDYRNIPYIVADAKADTVRKIFAEIEKFGKRPIPEASPVYILKQRDLEEIRNKHIPRGTPQDTCISCGEVIPEGRQVCSGCISKTNKKTTKARKESEKRDEN